MWQRRYYVSDTTRVPGWNGCDLRCTTVDILPPRFPRVISPGVYVWCQVIRGNWMVKANGDRKLMGIGKIRRCIGGPFRDQLGGQGRPGQAQRLARAPFATLCFPPPDPISCRRAAMRSFGGRRYYASKKATIDHGRTNKTRWHIDWQTDKLTYTGTDRLTDWQTDVHGHW